MPSRIPPKVPSFLVQGLDPSQRLERDAKATELGFDPSSLASSVLEILPESRLEREQAVRCKGTVLWFDPELLRQLGFSVPPSNELTPELEEQILEAFSIRLVGEGEQVDPDDVREVYADRYGGYGTTAAGSGRAVFLPYLNACVKGVGKTRLSHIAPDGEPRRTDFQHSHGNLSTMDAAQEAAWGLLADHLFSEGSSRVAAFIDVGRHTTWPDGSLEYSVLEVRVGDQIRPGHVLFDRERGGSFSRDVFVEAARHKGLLVERPISEGGGVDLRATMQKIIFSHARTAAEMYSHRVLHGALSPSNMEIHGGQVDLTTMSAQERTAPIKVSDVFGTGGVFGHEHHLRALDLVWMWKAIVEALPPGLRHELGDGPLAVQKEFEKAYESELGRSFLRRTGLKSQLVQRLLEQRPAEVNRFRKAMQKLTSLGGSSTVVANVEKRLPERTGVLDVFGALRILPSAYFAEGRDHQSLLDAVRKALSPRPQDSLLAKKRLRRAIEDGSKELAKAYEAVMTQAERLGLDCYDDGLGFQRSVILRAETENEPMVDMYKANLRSAAQWAVDEFRHTGDRRVFRELIDKRVARSMRNVEAMFELGSKHVTADGALDLQCRSIDGIEYSVRAHSNGDRSVRLGLPVEEHGGRLVLQTLEGRPSVPKDGIGDRPSPFRYKFSLDGWQSSREAGAKVETDESGATRLVFELPVERSYSGRLEGLFHYTSGNDFWIHDAGADFRGYTFAVPDNRDLEALMAKQSS